MVKKKDIKNLIAVENELNTLELLEKIKKGEKVSVAIYPNGKGKQLFVNGTCAFVFDGCRCGNESYNAVSVIRDLLKQYDAAGQWTRKNVEPLVEFEKKTEVPISPNEEIETKQT